MYIHINRTWPYNYFKERKHLFNYFVKTRDVSTITGTWSEMVLENIEFIGTREKFLDAT